MSERERLTQWIASQMSGSGGEALRMIVVKHLHDSTADDIETFDNMEIPADSLAEAIDTMLEHHTHATGGAQRYGIYPYFGTQTTHKRSFAMRKCAPEEVSGAPDLSEGPTGKGITSMLMRHTNAATGLLIQGSQRVFQSLESVITELRAENKQLRADNARMNSEREAFMNQQHARNLATVQVANHERRMDKAYETVTLLAAPLINGLAGRNILPESASSKSVGIDTLISSIDEEQREAMTKILRPEQQVILFTIYQEIEAKKVAEAEEKAKAAQRLGATDMHDQLPEVVKPPQFGR